MPDAPDMSGAVDDPYLAWARAQGDDIAAASPLTPPPAAPEPEPARPPVDLGANAPGLGVPAGAVDSYASWARAQQPSAGPITAPDQSPPGPDNAEVPQPVTSPDESPASNRPYTPRNASGGAEALGGNDNPQDRAQRLAGMSPEQQAAAVESMSPEEKLRYETTRSRAQLLRQAELEHNAIADNERRAREDVEMQRAAMVKADADTREMLARANAIANTKIDPNRYGKGLGTAGRIGTVLLSAIGGAFAENTGGHNLALEQFNKQVENDIGAQHAELANAWHGIDLRRNAIAAEYERHGDLYKAQETYRQAAYTSAINDMQSQLQQFDPAGGTALAIRNQIDQFRATQTQQVLAFNQQQFKNDLENRKETREEALARSTILKNEAEAAKLRGAGGGGGGGSASNPNYSVATGFFDPFTMQPIMGKRAIGGKGEDPKERNQVDAQLATYAHVQDYWQKLAAIGSEVGNAKSAGESVWKARKSTLASEYDAAREALTVYLTKELGDKLTQGQLEAQAHRIPERASLFEARDPGKQIADAQSDADRDFARDMNLHGIDATPTIKAAQARRGNPSPSPEQALEAAASAVAADPTNKDAHAALAAAHERVRGEVAKTRERKTAIATVGAITDAPAPIKVPPPNPEFRTDEYSTAAKEANLAVDRYGALLRKFRADSAANTDETKLGALASEIIGARTTAEDKTHDLANEMHLRELFERSTRANAMVGAGRAAELQQRQAEHPTADPTLDVSRGVPPAPSTVPGLDDLLPPGQSYRAPPKRKH